MLPNKSINHFSFQYYVCVSYFFRNFNVFILIAPLHVWNQSIQPIRIFALYIPTFNFSDISKNVWLIIDKESFSGKDNLALIVCVPFFIWITIDSSIWSRPFFQVSLEILCLRMKSDWIKYSSLNRRKSIDRLLYVFNDEPDRKYGQKIVVFIMNYVHWNVYHHKKSGHMLAK